MSIKTALQSFTSATTLFIIASVFFVAGVTARVTFAAWVDPPDTPVPPNGGTAPINVANVDQEKKGGLYIASDEDGQLFVGVKPADADLKPRLQVNGAGAGLDYGISVTGAKIGGLTVDGQSTTDYGLYVSNAEKWGAYVLGLGATTGGGLYGAGGKYGVYGLGGGGSLPGDTYGVYGQGASASDIGGTSRSGVYGIAGEISLTARGSTYGVYAATFAGDTFDNTYALYVDDKATGGGTGTSYAAYIKGRSRIVDDASASPGALENSLDIYTDTDHSGLYVERRGSGFTGGTDYAIYGRNYIGTAGVRGDGGLYGVYATACCKIGGLNTLLNTYAVYAEAGDTFPGQSHERFGVYGKAGVTAGGSTGNTYGVYADTGTAVVQGTGGVYGLYAVNHSPSYYGHAAYIKDEVEIPFSNAATLTVESRSGGGLWVQKKGFYGGSGIMLTQETMASGQGLGIFGFKNAIQITPEDTDLGIVDDPTKSYTGININTRDSEVGSGITPRYGIATKVGNSTNFGKNIGVSVIATGENSIGLDVWNQRGGYAAKFRGLVDVGGDGFFSSGVSFFRNIVFAATESNTALVVGSTQPTGAKLQVEGEGAFANQVSADYLQLKDKAANSKPRYDTYIKSDATKLELCVDYYDPGDSQCSVSTQTCESRGSYPFSYTGNQGSCETKCQDLSFIRPEQVTCSWNCNGKIGYDDCFSDGTSTSGTELCTAYDSAYYEGDTFPQGICHCYFKGPGASYDQAAYNPRNVTPMCVQLGGNFGP